MPTKNILIENTQIRFRNFAGKAGQFNPEGQRNFCVLLEPEIAKDLTEDGWNVKWLEPRDPQDDRQAYLKVKVNYANVPPKIVLVTKHNQTVLNESTLSVLDFAEIESVDLVINPYNYDMRGQKGVAAYLKNMYVTIVEDPLAEKYRDIPDSAASAPDDSE